MPQPRAALARYHALAQQFERRYLCQPIRNGSHKGDSSWRSHDPALA
jgi:hypothetical protein